MNNEITKCPKCNSENVSFVAFRNDDVFYCKDCYYTPNEAFRLELEKHPIDVGITRNFEEWLNFVLDNEQAIVNRVDTDYNKWCRIDAGIAYYLSKKCNFAGFMLGPVAVYNKRSVIAKSRMIPTLDDFNLLIEYVNNSKFPVLLYSLSFYHTYREFKYEPFWKIRFGVVGED